MRLRFALALANFIGIFLYLVVTLLEGFLLHHLLIAGCYAIAGLFCFAFFLRLKKENPFLPLFGLVRTEDREQ